jgi:cell division protein FtsI/penicillin-binding protein 2
MVMQLHTEHELHGRRRSRNVGLGIVLIAFVALVFALTVVKVTQGHLMEAYDHQPRTSLLPMEPEAAAPAAEAAR